jgi:nicotinamide-nucleotide amidase
MRMMPSSLKDRAEEISKLAQARGITLATVESCTAGALALLLSQATGASKTLHGGFIVYTKNNKIAATGVPGELIAAHTAVSAQVAKAMAEGGLERCPADIVVAITGVAGPEPDEDGNPVGLTFIAAASRDGRTRVERHAFGGMSKEEICTAAMGAAIDLVEQLLMVQAP